MSEQLNICGPHVRRIRNSLGWSQQALAAKCQLAGWDATRIVIAKIEGQSRRVMDRELKLMARILGVSPLDLIPD